MQTSRGWPECVLWSQSPTSPWHRWSSYVCIPVGTHWDCGFVQLRGRMCLCFLMAYFLQLQRSGLQKYSVREDEGQMLEPAAGWSCAVAVLTCISVQFQWSRQVSCLQMCWWLKPSRYWWESVSVSWMNWTRCLWSERAVVKKHNPVLLFRASYSGLQEWFFCPRHKFWDGFVKSPGTISFNLFYVWRASVRRCTAIKAFFYLCLLLCS